MTDVRDEIVYKNEEHIEAPTFAIDGRGNIIFNFDEPRDVFICPMSRKKGIPETEFFYEYLDVNGTDIVPFYEPETDRAGNILLDDTTGRERLRTIFDREANQHIVKKFQLIIKPFSVKKISLPQDGWLLRYLLECPRNASVEFINNQSTVGSSKEFFIYDPYYETKRKSELRKVVKKAYEHSRALDSERQLQIVHVVLFSEKGYQKLSKLDLQLAIESFAKEHPQKYVDLIVENPNFELQALVQLALLNRFIKIGNTGEFLMFVENGNKTIPLGLSEMGCILFLRENPQIKNILIKDTEFDGYLAEMQNKNTKDSTIEAIKAKQSELDEQNRLLIAQNKLLKEQIANLSNGIKIESPSLNVPVPKGTAFKFPTQKGRPSKKQTLKPEPELV